MEPNKFVEREWNEGIEGKLDEYGFFYTPDGSFWDPDYVYFNKEGFDKHGGYYDKDREYIPGKGWDEINMCYYDDDDEDEFYDNHKEGQKQSEHYEDFEYEKDDALLEGESLDFANDPDIETIQVPLDKKNDRQQMISAKDNDKERPTEPKKIIIKTQNMNVNVNIPKDFISQNDFNQKPNYMKKVDNNMNYERSNNNFSQNQNYFNNQMNSMNSSNEKGFYNKPQYSD